MCCGRAAHAARLLAVAEAEARPLGHAVQTVAPAPE